MLSEHRQTGHPEVVGWAGKIGETMMARHQSHPGDGWTCSMVTKCCELRREKMLKAQRRIGQQRISFKGEEEFGGIGFPKRKFASYL